MDLAKNAGHVSAIGTTGLCEAMDRSANMTSTANLRVITNTVTEPMRVQCRKQPNHSRHPLKAPPLTRYAVR